MQELKIHNILMSRVLGGKKEVITIHMLNNSSIHTNFAIESKGDFSAWKTLNLLLNYTIPEIFSYINKKPRKEIKLQP